MTSKINEPINQELTSTRSYPASTEATDHLLRFSRYRFHMLATGSIRMPAYPGSAWRGLFGHALRDSVCVTGQPTCDSCLLRQNCVYSWLFETPVPTNAEKLRLYPTAPHPFVLDVAMDGAATFAPGATIQLGMTLFGKANEHLPYIIHALDMAGDQGLGHSTGTFKLFRSEQETRPGSEQWHTIYRIDEGLNVHDVNTVTIPSPPVQAKLMLLTPLRVKRDGRTVTPKHFAFHDLYRNLLRRLSLLAYFHGEKELDLDFATCVNTAKQIQISQPELEWYDWRRFSSRQNTAMDMGGIIGSFPLSEDILSNFWPHLWLGQWTHVGKATSMGMGQYRIQAASLQAPSS